MEKPLLEVKDVSYAYHTKSGETPALSHISFSISPGEFAAIVGPSGCGNAMAVLRKQKSDTTGICNLLDINSYLPFFLSQHISREVFTNP